LKQILLTQLLLIFFFGLANGQTDSFPTGQIIDTIHSLSNPKHSYSLYLPSYYSKMKKYPVVFVYDAGARGRLGVAKFQNAAEKLGYVIIGSHNFRNGAFDSQLEAINYLFEDVPKRVAVDPNRFYTSGLSGGARMATTTAVLSKAIKGVIACAAGQMLDYPIEQNAHFDFVSVAGNSDMNYLELYLLHEKLQSFGDVSHKRIEFEGRHKWPFSDQLLNALRWLDFLSMKRNLKDKNESLIQELIEEEMKMARNAKEKKQLDVAYQIYNDLVRHFDGWGDITLAKERLVTCQIAPEWNDVLNRKAKLIKKEKQQQDWFNQGLIKIPYVDFVSIVKKMKTQLIDIDVKEKATTDALEKMMWSRVKGYVSLATFSQGSSYLNQGIYKFAIPYFEIWEATNVDSYWMSYYLAKVYALADNERDAINSYKEAIKKGMAVKNKKSKKEILKQLRDKKEFSKIIDHIINDFI